MLYFIYGTHAEKRKIAKEKIWREIGEDFLIARKIDKSNVDEIGSYVEAVSMFGEKLVIELEDLLTLESSRSLLYDNLENIIKSNNIFILDEPFALAASVQKVVKEMNLLLGSGAAPLFSKEGLGVIEFNFDCTEKIVANDLSPGKFCDLIEERDKRGAFIEWQKIYAEWGNAEEQFLIASLWYRWKSVWTAKLNGKDSNYDFFSKKSRPIKYSLKELESFGKEISLMSMKSNNGEIDMMREIEKLLLKI